MRIRPRIVLLLTLGLATAWGAVEEPVVFSDPDGSWSAEFPTTPKRSTSRTAVLRSPSSYTTVVALPDAGYCIYTMTVSSVDEGERVAPRRSREEQRVLHSYVSTNARVMDEDAQVVSTTEVPVGEGRGLEFVIVAKVAGVPVVKRGFVALARGRIFSASVTGPATSHKELDTRYDAFAKTVKIKPGE